MEAVNIKALQLRILREQVWSAQAALAALSTTGYHLGDYERSSQWSGMSLALAKSWQELGKRIEEAEQHDPRP